MPSIEELQAYLRRAIRPLRDVVEVPPFTIYFSSNSAQTYYNYAIPNLPVDGDVKVALDDLRAVFASRARQPRFEFIAEYAPELPAALHANGFYEESRLQLMLCTPASFTPPAARPELHIVTIDQFAPAEAICESMNVNERGFNPDTTPVGLAEADDFRYRLGEGRMFTAYLNDQAAGAGMYTAPLDGLTELVGIATLEAFRRQGVASALTAHAANEAFNQGVAAAFLSAADAQAGRVYERVGFQPYATMLAYLG